jgi:hypothetical protein
VEDILLEHYGVHNIDASCVVKEMGTESSCRDCFFIMGFLDEVEGMPSPMENQCYCWKANSE